MRSIVTQENFDVSNADSEAIHIEIYENEIPSFVESVLEGLYSSIYTTVMRLQLYDNLMGVNTCLMKEGTKIVAAILYRISRETIYVLNQQVVLPQHLIVAFAKYIFFACKQARKIEFYALDLSVIPQEFSFPYQQVAMLEENVISLPKSVGDYINQVRPKMRKEVLRSIKMAKPKEQSYRFEILSGDQIHSNTVNAIIRLTDKRMSSKNLPSYISDTEISKLAILSRKYGGIAVIRINDEICAGHIWFNVGKRYFSHLMGHDPNYNKYGLGNQVQFLAILHCISAGGEEYCMMGGGSEHKIKFLAHRRVLNNVTLYRSRLDMIFNWRTYTRNYGKQKYLCFKDFLKSRAAVDGVIGPLIRHGLNVMRNTRLDLKRSIRRINNWLDGRLERKDEA